MDNDDQLIGRVLSRREVLTLLGAASASLLASCGPTQTGSGTATQAPTTTAAAATGAPTAAAAAATDAPTTAAATTAPTVNAEGQTTIAITSEPAAQAQSTEQIATAVAANGTTTVPACVVRPEVTEGPYYVQEDLVRTDIRTDSTTGTARDGIPLVLTFNISQVASSGCTPFTGATIEVWHCDATGAYSDVSDPGFNTVGQNWLRGAQVTDASGKATFTTIYPGWYASRAVHIHYKVHPDESKVFTSQLFFDDTLSDEVFTQTVYNKGQRDTLNSNDSIYQDLMLLTTTKTADGYASTFDIGLDLSTIGTGESNGGGGPGGGPPPNGTRGPGGPPPGSTSAPTGTP